MRRILPVLLLLALAGPVGATGLLIPVEKKLPPLAMLNHQVDITIDDQVAITRIEQTFRNHTDRPLEATYIMPVPKGASVRKFVMWVDGKEMPGELVEAAKARQIYTDIVRRTQDPGLLEYMENNVFRLRVFPIPPRGDQKIAISYTSVAVADQGVVEYRYPLKTDGKALETLEKFAINLTLKSQHPVQNIYSPSHAITITRPNEREARIAFEKDQATLDKDFQLFYTSGTKDVGMTTVLHRPTSGNDGYFMLLVSPRAELSKSQQVPRDMVFVLDTSGSMRGKRMIQARHALKQCLNNLAENDRFSIINFATTVNRFTDNLQPATSSNVTSAQKWADTLEATGGTAINDALAAALALRSDDKGRTFSIVFFTDGRPTIGETNGDQILKNALAKNSTNTRIFTFGVGDDVNATLLDQLAEQSRAIVTYVREAEDIDAKVTGLYNKISHPVLANLKLAVSPEIKLYDVYPPQLPDLFHGTQLVVFGRYKGQGTGSIDLTGNIGMEVREFGYEVAFADQTKEDKSFVEDLWARRKVGYLLDQIRINGEQKELVEEVTNLAKRYGITTPYTSHLIVPDAVTPLVRRAAVNPALPNVAFHLNGGDGKEAPSALQTSGGGQRPVAEFIKEAQHKAGEAGKSRGDLAEKVLNALPKDDKSGKSLDKTTSALNEARDRFFAYRQAGQELKYGQLANVQNGTLGVNLSVASDSLRNVTCMQQNAQRWIGTRNCLEVGGVWIDEAYEASMKTVTIKAHSEAYFRCLERHPELRKVFTIGNYLVWVSPSGTALVVDAVNGEETMTDTAIDALFVAKK